MERVRNQVSTGLSLLQLFFLGCLILAECLPLDRQQEQTANYSDEPTSSNDKVRRSIWPQQPPAPPAMIPGGYGQQQPMTPMMAGNPYYPQQQPARSGGVIDVTIDEYDDYYNAGPGGVIEITVDLDGGPGYMRRPMVPPPPPPVLPPTGTNVNVNMGYAP